MFYYTMWHRGGLNESFETIWEIEEETFKILIKNGLYKRYGYDKRISAVRYLLNKIDVNLGMPTWLLESEKELY